MIPDDLGCSELTDEALQTIWKYGVYQARHGDYPGRERALELLTPRSPAAQTSVALAKRRGATPVQTAVAALAGVSRRLAKAVAEAFRIDFLVAIGEWHTGLLPLPAGQSGSYRDRERGSPRRPRGP